MTHAFIDFLNHGGQHWATWMIVATLNSAALLAVVSVLWFVIRRRVAPQVGYCLVLLVPLKLLLPIGVSLPPQIARWTPSVLASQWFEGGRDSTQRSAQRPVELKSEAIHRGESSHAKATEARADVSSSEPTKATSDVVLATPVPPNHVASSASDGMVVRPADVMWPRVTKAAAFMLVWLGVVAWLFCRLVYGQLRFLRRLRIATPISERQLNFKLQELVRRAGVGRRVKFVECDDIAAPAVTGIIRPTIILPRGIAATLTTQQLQWVLLHELAHVRRHDVLAVVLQRCVAILYFFNPAVWIANRIASRLREYACDDFALAMSKVSTVESGQAFLQVLRYASESGRLQGALGIFGFDSRTTCKLRIERMLNGDRLIRTRAGVVSIVGILLLAIVALPYVRAATEVETDVLTAVVDKSPANLSGVVKAADDEPIKDALVSIYSAGVRVGYSPFCPTCYADCGKRTTTAADGAFTIEKLDPSLVFRVLVVAKGYEPKFVTKVDPVKAKQLEVSLKARAAAPDDRTRVVAGQVLSPGNTPLAGALVEPFGCKTSESRWWGSMPGVDPLAVSDDTGHFEIVTAKPVEAIDLEISGRGVATKKFALVPSGKTQNRLQMSAGATVLGRLVDHGQPLPGVLIGLAQADRSGDNYISATQIGTNSDGQFLLTNVPPDREYFVYGIMNSMLKRGAVVARKLKVAGDNTTTDVGELAVEPAFRIAGRVALSDGKPLPAHTRVLFSREDAWDSQTVQADANGRFEARGIPKGVISITASVPEYHASEKNKSLERLNGTSLKGLVTADIDELTILLEPGKQERHDWSKSRAEWRAVVRTLDALKVEPPVGVAADLEPIAESEPNVIQAPRRKPVKALPKIDGPAAVPAPPAADADVPQRRVTGRVRDHEGKPVADTEVLLPVRWVAATNFLTARTKSAADGTFELKFPAEWVPDDVTHVQSTVWAYADGHSIGVGNAHKQLRDKNASEACDVELGPPADTQFTVVFPDGRLAVGVQVKPLHFLSWQGYNYVPPEVVAITAATTDSAGHVSLPAYPIDKMLDVDVVTDELGTQQFRDFKREAGSNEQLKLQSVGRIEGRVVADQPELFRGMLIFIETEGDRSNAPSCAGQAMLTVGEDGRFVVPQIAEGMIQLDAHVDDRLPVRPRLPDRNDLEVVAGKTTRIEIPLEMTVPVHGVIRIKGSNKPVSGAKIYVNYGVGRQGEDVTSDDAGRYAARVLPGSVGMQVIHVPNNEATQLIDSRSARHVVPEGGEDLELPPIELTKTTTLSGRLLDSAGKPVANRRISGVKGNGRYGFGESDKNGDFKLADVPEGMKLEKFEVWPETSGRPLESTVDSTDPLVVRLK